MVDQRRVALLSLGDVFVGVFSDLTEALVAFVDEDMDAAGAGIAESGAARAAVAVGDPRKADLRAPNGAGYAIELLIEAS